MDWGSLQIGSWWPAGLILVAALLLAWVWYRSPGQVFPDVELIAPGWSRLVDRLPIVMGCIIVLLLTVALMHPSMVMSAEVERTARDFIIIVDVSGSMTLTTDAVKPDGSRYQRWELAQEALQEFLAHRRPYDRVALLYFDHRVTLMSSFTTNIAFVQAQAAVMGEYVVGGTELAKAMQVSLDLAERWPAQAPRAVVLLTDAEVWGRAAIEEQYARLAQLGYASYLLWIFPARWESYRWYLVLAEDHGPVFTIENLDAGNLAAAFAEIDRLESSAYIEEQRRRTDLAPWLLDIARWLVPVWVLAMATVYYPRGVASTFGEDP